MTDMMEYPGGQGEWITVRKKRDVSHCTDRPTQVFKNIDPHSIPVRSQA